MSVCPNISDNSRAISREWDGVGGGGCLQPVRDGACFEFLSIYRHLCLPFLCLCLLRDRLI